MPFDESDGLRQTFANSFWGELEESGTAAEARAAVVDLRYLQVYLSRFDPEEFDPEGRRRRASLSKLAASKGGKAHGEVGRREAAGDCTTCSAITMGQEEALVLRRPHPSQIWNLAAVGVLVLLDLSGQ
jgi:hypothetical protein